MSRDPQEPVSAPPSGAGDALAGWVQNVVPYGIFTTDHDLRVTSWNEWLVIHSGRSASDVCGRLLTDLFPDLTARRLIDKYRRALAGETSVLAAALHKHLLPFPVTVAESGLPHMLQTARIAPVSEQGATVGTVTIIEDVTQREFHAAILNRQQEIDRLLSTALAALLQSNDPVSDMGGIFASVRLALKIDAFVSYLLTPDEKGLQLNSSAGIPPKQRETLAFLPLAENDFIALRGSSIPAALNVADHREKLAASGLLGRCSFPLSVGERIIGLVAFGSYQRETFPTSDLNVLARIARYVALAVDRARREQETVAASRAKDDFLAALSHELRTPLNPVLLLASDSVDNPAFPQEARDAFRIIEKNALLEARLIDDLLDLTRIIHGKMAIEMQSLTIDAVLSDAITTVRPDIGENSLSLHTALHGGSARVLGDSGRLQQVFWNVLKNSVKFTPHGGRIAVKSSVDSAAGEIVIEVSDTGIGMDSVELARIFGAFSQGDHALQGRSHRFGGLGLGLAISRRIVEMHAGRIDATSAGKGHGSTFIIYLPLAPTDNDASPADEARHGATPGAAESRPPIHLAPSILLVEDHEATRVTLTKLLKHRGYRVVAAATAESALKEAARGRFNLVLSDIGLPDSDGFVLMKRLRDTYGLKGVALTGYGMEEDLLRSNDAGFFAHLTKPISVKTLDRVLEQAFQTPAQ